MRYGLNLFLWTTDVRDEHLPLLERARKHGYDGVEIPIGSRMSTPPQRLREALDDAGLACTTMTSVDAERHTASPDPAIRRRALEELRFAIDASQTMGSETLVGPYQAAYAHFTGSGPTQEELEWSAEVLRAASEEAAEAELRLAVEFLNRHEGYLLNTMEQSAGFARRVDHPAFGVLYDTHHAHAEEDDVGAAIRGGIQHIYEVHFSESNRGLLGAGLVDWDATCRALREGGYDGWIVAEAFAHDVPGLSSAAHVWRSTFPSKDEFARTAIEFMRERLPATG
jgi:D-psicose/D-tagatose/L-ribulose 3-epimerase